MKVLVTDAEERSALAACRGLAAAGYRVSAAASRPLAVGRWSRFVRSRVWLPAPGEDGYAEALAAYLHRESHDLILAGSEASMLVISEHRDELPAATGLPSHDRVLRALDKLLLQREAAEVGLGPPEGEECTDAVAAAAAAGGLGWPVVVKPARSFDAALRKGMVRVCADAGELFAAVDELRPPVTVQRFVAGAPIISVAGVRLRGGIHGLTVARYDRTWPPCVGSASFARTVSPPPGLIEAVEQLLARVGWTGIFELELLDLGDRLAAIDLNPRVFGWLALAVAAGANLPAIWCDHVLGRAPSGSPARAGTVFRWEDGELRRWLRAAGHLRLGEAIAVARPRRHVVHAYFLLTDPGPLIARGLAPLRREAPDRERRFQSGAEASAAPE